MAEDGVPMRPEEAFSHVASDARYGILQALWDHKVADEGSDRVSFSSLHEATAIRDSGQFNYHLEKLVPRFVRAHDDGYELTYAGTQIVAAAVSGVYTEADVREVDPLPVGPCPDCGGTFEASYGGGHISIACRDCAVRVTELPAPPVIAATADRAALPAVFSRRLLADIIELNAGFCLRCGGRVDRELDRSFSDEVDAGDARLGVRWRCRACGSETSGVIGAAVLDHPAVVAFLYDHDLSLRDTYLWELDWLFQAHATVEATDPERVRVSIPYGGERLDLTLDASLEVVESNRVPDAGAD